MLAADVGAPSAGSNEHLVMIYLLEVGQNYRILANTAGFDDIVYQISPH
jgi:hypothetical protein